MKTFTLKNNDESGQSVIILSALLFVVIALLILATISNINSIRDKRNLTDAAIEAATNGVAVGTETSNREFDEDKAILAACQTMDDHLPIKILSIGFGRATMRVTVAYRNAEGDEDRATYTTFYAVGDENETSGIGEYEFGATLDAQAITSQVDGCQGRVVT